MQYNLLSRQWNTAWQRSTSGKGSEKVKEKHGKLRYGQIGIVENNSHNQMLWTEGLCVETSPPQFTCWIYNLRVMVFGDRDFRRWYGYEGGINDLKEESRELAHFPSTIWRYNEKTAIGSQEESLHQTPTRQHLNLPSPQSSEK